MQTDIVISGFGGQGVLFAGQLLAYSALESGLQVTWFPSYGPEMRGGTAHCIVIISDEEIGSPIVGHPQAAIVMNLPSLDKYESQVRSGGLLLVNSSLVDREPAREDLEKLMIPANVLAQELGDSRLANSVMLGALLHRLPVISLEAVANSLAKHISERHRHLIGLNLKALEIGAKVAARQP